MMNKRKVCIVTTSRADFSKLEPLYQGLLNAHDVFEPILVMSGSHLLVEGGNTWRDIEQKYDVAAKAYTVVSGDTLECMAESVSLGISKFTSIFSSLKPDCVVVHGDRFDALAVAVTSSLLHIYTVHIEGGELSGTIDGSLRHAITKLSHLHFVCNEQARTRLLRMGEAPNTVVLTGCPSYDRFKKLNMEEESLISVCKSWGVVPFKFAIVMQHPDTVNRDSTVRDFKAILQFFESCPDPILFFYPNIDPGNKRIIKLLHEHQKSHQDVYRTSVKILSHVPFDEFAILLRSATCIIGNSSAVVREACFFGTPAVLVGNRQEGRDLPRNVRAFDSLASACLVNVYKDLRGVRYAPHTSYGSGNAVDIMIAHLAESRPSTTSKIFNDACTPIKVICTQQTAVTNINGGDQVEEKVERISVAVDAT